MKALTVSKTIERVLLVFMLNNHRTLVFCFMCVLIYEFIRTLGSIIYISVALLFVVYFKQSPQIHNTHNRCMGVCHCNNF